ncbi:MAG: 3-oxoacyl-[acyl-carrier-protein] reductase [Candidatus Glassbacteria bacterium]
MDLFLEGKKAIVTGGAFGIGSAIVERLAEMGAKTVIGDIDGEAASSTAAAFSDRGLDVKSFTVDVSSTGDVKRFFDEALEHLEGIDVLVNNAGITRDGLFIRMSDEDWDLVNDVNLKGTYNCMKQAIIRMMKQKSGKIVNISSVVGIMGNAGQANYAASKAGVIGLSKSIAKEVASRNITVNVVAPGFIETRMTDALTDDQKAAFLTRIPMGRAGQADDVAKVVLFLCSPLADYITGQVINVDGGMLM